jgi:hypothetical protein
MSRFQNVRYYNTSPGKRVLKDAVYRPFNGKIALAKANVLV